jgi:hypothetical protein
MRNAWWLFVLLLAMPALGSELLQGPVAVTEELPVLGCVMGAVFVSEQQPCGDEAPATHFNYPLCTDYELDTSLIEAARKRDRSAVELLQRRFATTVSWDERARVGAALLGRVANDAEIWKELQDRAEDYLRFSEEDAETKAKLEAWCTERGYDAELYLDIAFHSFDAIVSDPRSHPLLLRALASSNHEVVTESIYGFAQQNDLSALPLIDEALARFDEAPEMAEMLCLYHSAAADQLAMKYITDEDDQANYRAMRQQ